MGVDEGRFPFGRRLDQRRLGDLLELRLDEVEIARLAAAGCGIDDDDGVVALEQLVGEVDALDAEVGHHHALGQVLLGEATDDLAAESIVGEEDVAHAGHEHLLRHASTSGPLGARASTSSGEK